MRENGPEIDPATSIPASSLISAVLREELVKLEGEELENCEVEGSGSSNRSGSSGSRLLYLKSKRDAVFNELKSKLSTLHLLLCSCSCRGWNLRREGAGTLSFSRMPVETSDNNSASYSSSNKSITNINNDVVGEEEEEEDKEKERKRVNQTSLILRHARQNRKEALDKVLEEAPSLVNVQDYDGRTALHVAALHGNVEAAECLIQHGAHINAQDRWNNSPLADAESANHQDMVELLKAHGAESLGNHGTCLEAKAVPPPLPQKCDWEIDRSELDFSKSSVIGKGSFGEILIANWRGTPVAVKRILPALSNDKLVIEDFRKEVNLLVKLRHPNIVQFLGAVTTPPLMLVTEFLRGGDLHQFLKEKGALSASTAVDFALDIARGMAYLHNGPKVIIHRDLKPRNILMVNSTHLKVGDFGLSKLVHVKHAHDMYKLTGETGSYRYMAPEVFEHRRYDTKVDVFSFAMILYQMFEGYVPFPNYEAYEAARLVANGDRPMFRARCYPAELKKLIEDCWNSDIQKRPSFLKIISILENIKNNLPHEHHWKLLHHV